ncbi:MAG: hypothetical protein K8S87_09050 [Planctomycetes bacterium]|nr:hypothetical protein [Planctomycetota bacterium]
MFYGVFKNFHADADKINLTEIFNAETELLYTLLSTNRLSMKKFSIEEHKSGILEFLETVGYESIFGREFIENFSDSVIESAIDMINSLPDTADIMLEKFFLVPDMHQMVKHFKTEFITEHLSRIKFLAEEMSKKHFGFSRRKLD